MRTLESVIEERGWFFNLSMGGWVHPDVRDDSGRMRPFDNAADVCDYLGFVRDEINAR
jgi:hypothetical protein